MFKALMSQIEQAQKADQSPETAKKFKEDNNLAVSQPSTVLNFGKENHIKAPAPQHDINDQKGVKKEM